MEELSFELLKIKLTTIVSMYGHDPALLVHLYTDSSGFAGGLVIAQFRSVPSKKELEVPIVYDSFTFSEICHQQKRVVRFDQVRHQI